MHYSDAEAGGDRPFLKTKNLDLVFIHFVFMLDPSSLRIFSSVVLFFWCACPMGTLNDDFLTVYFIKFSRLRQRRVNDTGAPSARFIGCSSRKVVYESGRIFYYFWCSLC